MKKKKIISIIIFPGSNCDRDLMVAIKRNLGIKPNLIWHQTRNIEKTDLIFLPGGFSYGDYLRAGIIATKSPAISEVIRLSKKGVPIVGICNGFQILTETGLLPGVLLQNKNIEFICKNVFVKINDKNNKYFNKINKEILELHIAHNEGNYFCSDDELREIENNNQIAAYYCDENGNCDDKSNPNGALKNIAGILNKEKNVLGMMPHPERMIDKYLSGDDGSIFFKNLLNNLKI